MTGLMAQFAQPFSFSWLRQEGVANGAKLHGTLEKEPVIDAVLTFRDPEDD